MTDSLRNTWLFALGKSISVVGSAVFTFAAGLYVLRITGSGVSFSLTLIFGVLPVVLVGPISGCIADRYPKKVLIVGSDILNGFLFLVLFCLYAGGTPIPVFYAATFINGCLTTLFSVCAEAGKPQLVEPAQITGINAVSKIIDSTASVLGPIIGGVLFGLYDFRLFCLINGISYLISSGLETGLRFRPMEWNASRSSPGVLHGLADGLKFLLGRREIGRIAILGIAINIIFSFSITVPIPFILNTVLEFSPRDFGIVESAFPLGIIAGSLLLRFFLKGRLSTARILSVMSVVLSVVIILSALPLMSAGMYSDDGMMAFYFSVMALFGIIVAFIDIPYLGFFQTEVPDEYRGRVMSLITSFGKAVNPLAFIVSGLLLRPATACPVVFGGGMTLLVFGIAFALVSGAGSREPGRDPVS